MGDGWYSSTHTHGGRRDPTAIIGHAPEHRDWKPGDPAIQPEIDPTARIEAFVTIDAGMHCATSVGARAWLMKHVHIGHDAQIGDDCELAPGVVVCGHAILEPGVRMGVNSCVQPYRTIAKGARIGSGAVVTKDVPAGEVWIGNPARPIERHATDKLRPVQSA